MSYSWTGAIIIKRVRDAVILNFRRAFSYDTKYPYVLNNDNTVNFDCSKIVINDATPEDYYFLPSINVMTANGDEHRFIQEDFFEEFTDDNGEQSARRGAPLDITVSVEATALDVITRDELVDRMYEKFKLITDDLANNGIGILKTSIKPDRKEFKGDRWFYTSGVNLYLYAEWIDEDLTAPDSTAASIKGVITTDAGVSQGFKVKF